MGTYFARTHHWARAAARGRVRHASVAALEKGWGCGDFVTIALGAALAEYEIFAAAAAAAATVAADDDDGNREWIGPGCCRKCHQTHCTSELKGGDERSELAELAPRNA